MKKRDILLRTNIPGLDLLTRGKVRDIYDAGPEHLLIVTTDRLSAFDVVLPDGIPGKGAILTALSAFWFEELSDLLPHHLVSTNIDDFPKAARRVPEQVAGRAMLVRRATPLPIECIARGYLAGSGLVDYRKDGAISGVRLPSMLPDAARLDPPIFTPSTKAERGVHDQNINFDDVVTRVGRALAERIRAYTMEIYARASAHAGARGILVADTKMEFGELPDGTLILIDEVLTPDASRFWLAPDWTPNRAPVAYDKQLVRNYLLSLPWDHRPPAPHLPPEIIARAAARYQEIAGRLMGPAD